MARPPIPTRPSSVPSTGGSKRLGSMRPSAEGGMTKAQERAAKALASARQRDSKTAIRAARGGVLDNDFRKLERLERIRKERVNTERGTSISRMKRHDNDEEEEAMLLNDELELDQRAIHSRLGIAMPLPRSILRPTKLVQKSSDIRPTKPDAPIVGSIG